jgi:hypothetical protein
MAATPMRTSPRVGDQRSRDQHEQVRTVGAVPRGATRASELVLTFAEMERIVDDSLPASAHNHGALSAKERNGPHPHPRAWTSAGWRVSSANLAAEHVASVRR